MDFQEFLYCLIICFLLSFLIGIERQYRRRIIGLRTTILVSIGAFLFVNFSFSVGAQDISRIASQVVTGIGFLGAGVILKDGKKVRGLTTAATLWCDAAIGILCAGSAIKEAILGTIIILFSNIILRYVNIFINKLSSNKNLIYNYRLHIKCISKDANNLKSELNDFFLKNRIEIKNFTIKEQVKITSFSFNIIITKENIINLQQVLDRIYSKYKLDTLEFKKIAEIKEESEDDL